VKILLAAALVVGLSVPAMAQVKCTVADLPNPPIETSEKLLTKTPDQIITEDKKILANDARARDGSSPLSAGLACLMGLIDDQLTIEIAWLETKAKTPAPR
jgi:hypothetical protein